MFRSSREVISRLPVKLAREPDEVYGCDYCSDGGWNSETEVELHNTSKHMKSIKSLLTKGYNICGTCFKEFNGEENLLKHIKMYHLYSNENSYRVERDIFICHLCNQLFFNKQHLIIHQFRHNSALQREIDLQCPCCQKYKNYSKLYSHLYCLKSSTTCRICFSKCKNRKDLLKHLKKHISNLTCEMCGVNYTCSTTFNDHIRTSHKAAYSTDTKHKEDFKKYYMPTEDYLVGRGEILLANQGVHIPNNVKICVLCREICLGQDDMKNHILMEHGTKIKEIKKEPTVEHKCVCGEKFINKVLLKHHVFKQKGDHKVVSQMGGR